MSDSSGIDTRVPIDLARYLAPVEDAERDKERATVKVDLALVEQANNAAVLLRALALTYPDKHPDAVILNATAEIACGRVLWLLGQEPVSGSMCLPPLRLVDSEARS